MHKGNDQATLGVEDANNEDAEERNEVEEFKNKRYVSGGEAAWRNRGNELAERKPAVSRLQIHLPGEQTVFFDSNNKDESIERIEKSKRTKLTSFLNSIAKKMKMVDMQEHCCTEQFLNILLGVQTETNRDKERGRNWSIQHLIKLGVSTQYIQQECRFMNYACC